MIMDRVVEMWKVIFLLLTISNERASVLVKYGM